MIECIKKVTVKKREKVVDDFNSAAKLPVNLTVSKSVVSDGLGYRDTLVKCPTESDPVALCKVGQRVFVKCADAQLYVCDAQGFSAVGSVGDGALCLTEVRVNGNAEVLAVGSSGAFIVGLNAVEDLPKATAIHFHKGRYFIAENRALYFTELFDFNTDSASLKISGKLWFDDNSGNINGFLSQGSDLFVFCTRAVYKLHTIGDLSDFIVEKFDCDGVDIKENSFATEKDSCAYFNGRKLFRFYGGKFIEFDSVLDGLEYSVSGSAVLECGKYYLPIITSDGDNSVFVYDLLNNSQSLVKPPKDGIPLCNYAVQNGTVYQIGALPNGKRELILHPIDFDDCRPKTLCALNVKTGGGCTLKISGDFGAKTYTLKPNYNALTLNLKSRAFTLGFFADGGFSLRNLSLKYRLKGE